MDEIEVPSHFLCPISMELMRDPVTVSTGITYDRENIERWLFSCNNNNNTCPATKQVLSGTEVTPNHTLRRLIQSWCTLNAIERIPTPKPPVDKSHIVKILNKAKEFPNMQLDSLRRLRSIAFESERNKRCLEESACGVVEFLASIIEDGNRSNIDIAIEILSNLKISETHLKNLINNGGDQFVESLMKALRFGNNQSRASTTVLLKSMFEVADPNRMISIKREFFREIVRVLQDKISQQASKAALKLLVELCPWGRNRIKAVEGGAVVVLIELLIEASSEKRVCELLLVVLDQLCGCAEGRAELSKHAAGVAVVSKKILRVSHVATDRAVRILCSVCRFSATSRVLQEMLQLGVVSKLCLVLQVDSSLKTRDRAREILKLHSRVWKNSSCIPAHLLSSYPSS